MSVILSNDTQTSLDGINLQWQISGLQPLQEITLIYFQNVADADIQMLELSTSETKQNLLSLVSGSSYSFQLQVMDVSAVTVYSNTLILTAPYVLVAPSIQSVIGLDAGLKVTLAPTTNTMLNGGVDTVEFVLKNSTNNQVFWIVKTISSNNVYTLSSADNAALVNNTNYRIACMYQPVNSPYYTSPSPISSSVTCMPSNYPNVVTGLTAVSSGYDSLALSASWTRPSDFSEWSANGFSIVLTLFSQISGQPVQQESQVTLTTDVTTYRFVNLARGKQFYVDIYYTNSYGQGPDVSSSFVTVTSTTDAPTLSSVLEGDTQVTMLFSKSAFIGQLPDISGYYIYNNGVRIATLPSTATSYVVTGLTNGVQYSLAVSEYNYIGEGTRSDPLSAIPYGQMTVQSLSVVNKTVTAVLNPNGRAIQSVLFIALDSSPDQLVDGSFIYQVPVSAIPTSASGSVTVSYTFSQFASNVNWEAVIAHNPINSAFAKSS